VKGISCGNACISATKSCDKPLSPTQKVRKERTSSAAKKTKPAESPKVEEQKPEIEKARKQVSKGKSETVEKPSPVESVEAGEQKPEIEKDRKPKTNNKNLQSTRQAIVDEVGEETVARAEAAVKSILNSDDKLISGYFG
jgi:hypothetical protein